ncbi:hypothetical protein CONPUDRAFT_137696, partial [Coniophora puteana RWD-64-598 SS2]
MNGRRCHSSQADLLSQPMIPPSISSSLNPLVTRTPMSEGTLAHQSFIAILRHILHCRPRFLCRFCYSLRCVGCRGLSYTNHPKCFDCLQGHIPLCSATLHSRDELLRLRVHRVHRIHPQRSVLAQEGRLAFNTNASLFSATRGNRWIGPNDLMANVSMTALLVLSFASSSLAFETWEGPYANAYLFT